MYNFSVPMPYTKQDIDKLVEINKQIEKSKIRNLYGSLPSTCNLYTGFEQNRNLMMEFSNWDYWKSLIEYAISKNFNFVYLLNNPNRLQIENSYFEYQLDKLDRLLSQLYEIGVQSLRISEHKLISYIEKYYPYFNIYASTSFEFKTLFEYKNFIFMHHHIKQIVPSHDIIKNFSLLQNYKKILPNVEIEIMANEGCIKGCPNRDGHAGEILDRDIIHRNNIIFSNKYYSFSFCSKFEKFNPFLSIIFSNIIYPWEIDEYKKIGISNFKLVGRDSFKPKNKDYLNLYLFYLKGIDDIKNIQDLAINTFNHHLKNNPVLQQLNVKDCQKYLPNIKHFRKYGHLCASRCGVECRYCYKCAEKIQKVFEKKLEEQKKRNIPVCY